MVDKSRIKKRRDTFIAYILIVHGQQHEDVCGTELDSEHDGADGLLRPSRDKRDKTGVAITVNTMKVSYRVLIDDGG